MRKTLVGFWTSCTAKSYSPLPLGLASTSSTPGGLGHVEHQGQGIYARALGDAAVRAYDGLKDE